MLLLALGVAAILFDGFGIQSRLGNRLFDAYQRHAARPFADLGGLPVRVLELPALDEDRLVEITRALTGQGARLIVFTAPVQSGLSPQSLAARLPPGSDVARAALAKLPEPGHDLADAIAETKAILPVMLGETGREPHPKARFVYRGTRDPFARVPGFGAASAPPPVLENNAAGVAAPNLLPDPDGVVRRLPVAWRAGAALVPGMAAEALRIALDRPDITVISDERDPLSFLSGIGIAALETPGGRVPTGKNGAVWLRYAADASQRMLNPEALGSGTSLKGAIVVVGIKGDVVKMPLGLTSTANVIGDGIENLAGNTALSRPGWTRPVEALVLAALGIAMLALLRFGLGWAAALALAATAFMALGSWYLYAAQSVLTDWLTPALFLALTFAAGAFAWLQDRQSAYDGLRLIFSDSLPAATLRKIARRPELLKMERETRTVTYLVCGLHAADAKDDPSGFSPAMQRALTPLIDQILSRGGTLDRMTADGFAAFWNAPLDDADHARHACEAAEAIAAQAGDAVLHAGIATGAVVAGGVAGHGYAVQGDVVSFAQRIEAMAERYAVPLVASEGTRRLADRSFAFLEIDTIAGPKNAPIALYALAGNQVVRASPKFRALAVFHDHIFQAIRKQNWRMARDLIGQCRRLSGANQALYDLHLARIAFYERNLPGADWDGAFRAVLE